MGAVPGRRDGVAYGGFGSTGGANDQTDAGMAQGHDTATQTENEANAANSKFAGLVGFIEFRLQLRLSQALNHLLRSQLFERIQTLPSPLLNDRKIGDSLYRVMYETPALTNVFSDHHVAGRRRMVVIIAHRLSTMANANKIVFLEDGKILEQGTHDSLMANAHGHYHRFVTLQSAL